MTSNKNFKITIVGDGYVGKTCLLNSYKAKESSCQINVPAVLDNYNEDYYLDNSIYTISLWDTTGQEDCELRRTLSYSNTDCFILCYAINEMASYLNIKEKWHPHLRKCCPFTPIILAATKCDLRNPLYVTNFQRSNLALISTERGVAVAREIKAVAYCECSAQSTIGIEDVVEQAVKACVKFAARKKNASSIRKKKCTIL